MPMYLNEQEGSVLVCQSLVDFVLPCNYIIHRGDSFFLHVHYEPLNNKNNIAVDKSFITYNNKNYLFTMNTLKFYLIKGFLTVKNYNIDTDIIKALTKLDLTRFVTIKGIKKFMNIDISSKAIGMKLRNLGLVDIAKKVHGVWVYKIDINTLEKLVGSTSKIS